CFCVVLALLSRRINGWPLFLAGLLFALNFYSVHYSRAGLLEPQVNALASLLVLCVFLSLRHVVWLAPATLFLALTFFTKQTGLYLAPLFLIGGGTAIAYAMGRRAPWWQ